MKQKLFMPVLMALCLLSTVGCSHDSLWDAINETKDRVTVLEEAAKIANTNIKSLQEIVTSLQKNVYIKSVEQITDGYKITFSDGSTATIKNGKDAPALSVKKDTDGKYYWTLGGEWLLVEGKKVAIQADAPQVRINSTTEMWEISTDGGTTWTSTGVVAKGEDGDSLFSDVDTTSDENYVIFTLADGTEFKIAKAESIPSIKILNVDLKETQAIKYGQKKTYKVETNLLADYIISKPDGWVVSFDGEEKLNITAPVEANTYAEREGTISINGISTSGKSSIVKIQVKATGYELRVLTFEDEDAKFSSYVINSTNTINNWTDLVDSPQYGGALLYNDYTSSDYNWFDDDNTYLTSQLVAGGPFWSGGEAISNYWTADCTSSDFNTQLEITNGSAGAAGHNGSANFAIHYGYVDSNSWSTELSTLIFSDGEAHVIDHMYVTNSAYTLNSLKNGDSFASPAGPDSWFKIVITGYDENDMLVSNKAEFYLCNGSAKIVDEWTKFDLSVLGAVTRIEINMEASSDLCGDYGINTPCYFAYDDIAVRFE